MNTLRSTITAVLAVATALVASPSLAQDAQYQTATKFELPGAAGTAMRLAARLGGGSTESLETTYIKGNRMRTDVDESSTILDLEKRRFVMLDHAAKTYTVMTFEEMIQQAQKASEEMRRESQQAGAKDAKDGQEGQLNFRFAVDRANDRQRIAGYDAERVFLTMEAEGEFVPEGETQREKAGSLVVLTDMWTSKDIPVLDARKGFDDASARQYAEAGAAITKGIAAAFAEDPRLKVAFEQSAKEAQKIEGMPVRTVTSFVTVAPGQKFDRAALTEPQAKGASVAQRAGRAALGRLAAGIAGAAGQQQKGAEAEASPTQALLFRVTSEVRNVSTAPVDPSLFEIPAGYREVKPDGSL